jgi:hypothetical protein
MKGIKYLVDSKNRKVAVLIDLKKYGKLWEDFHDIIIAKERENEPRITLEEVKKKFDYEEYKKQIQNLSVWSEEDLKIFDEMRSKF